MLICLRMLYFFESADALQSYYQHFITLTVQCALVRVNCVFLKDDYQSEIVLKFKGRETPSLSQKEGCEYRDST